MKLRIPRLPGVAPSRPRLDFGYARGSFMYSVLVAGGLRYEADVSALLVALGRRHERTVFIDVGANISYFPVLLGVLFGDRFETHGFEPMPQLQQMSVAGLAANGVKASIRSEALGDRVGVGEFHLSATTDSSNSLNPHFRESSDVIEVPLSTLDAMFLEPGRSPLLDQARVRGESPPCIVMIDTESTEPDVLAGGLEFVSTVRPHIVCEVLAGRTEAQLERVVDRLGYLRYRMSENGPVLESTIVGDPTYRHRDWCFAPAPLSPEVCADWAELYAAFAGAKRPVAGWWRRLRRRW